MPRDTYVVILAATKREGYTYAKRSGIPARNCRIPLRAAQLNGLRRAEFHVLPSFSEAPHRHAVLSAVNRIRGVDVRFTFHEVTMPEPQPVEPNLAGEQMSLEDLMAQIEADEAALAEKQAAYAELVERHEQPVDDPRDHVGDFTAIGDNGEADEALERQHEVAIRYDRMRDAALADYVEPPAGDFFDGVRDGDSAEGDDDVEPEKPAKRRRSRCPDCGELRFPDDHEDCGAKVHEAPAPAPMPVNDDSPVMPGFFG